MSTDFSTEELLLLQLVQNFSPDSGPSTYNPPVIRHIQHTLSTVEIKFCREILLPSYLLHIIQFKLYENFLLSNKSLYDKSNSSCFHKIRLIRRLFLNLVQCQEYQDNQSNNVIPSQHSEFVDLFSLGRLSLPKISRYLMHFLASSLPKPSYFRLISPLLATFLIKDSFSFDSPYILSINSDSHLGD